MPDLKTINLFWLAVGAPIVGIFTVIKTYLDIKKHRLDARERTATLGKREPIFVSDARNVEYLNNLYSYGFWMSRAAAFKPAMFEIVMSGAVVLAQILTVVLYGNIRVPNLLSYVFAATTIYPAVVLFVLLGHLAQSKQASRNAEAFLTKMRESAKQKAPTPAVDGTVPPQNK